MGTALALALGKTLAAVDGAAEITLVIGAYVVTTDSGFGTSAVVTAAGCTAEDKAGSRSACSTTLRCEAAEVVIVAVDSTGTFKYACVAVPVGKFEYACTDA